MADVLYRFGSGKVLDGLIAWNASRSQVLRNKLGQTNVRAIKETYRVAEEGFRNSILRPQEHGHRPGPRDKKRKTGTFTFGPSGAFQARALNQPEKGLLGFGFPDIKVADRATERIWRVLEYGLGTWKASSAEAPVGDFRLPSRYKFIEGGDWKEPSGKASREGVLVPTGRGSFKAPGGIKPKFFIRDAFYSVATGLPGAYDRNFAEAIKQDRRLQT